MFKLYYQPKGYWFGDCMPYAENGKYYLYHQRDDRSKGPLGAPLGWSLAITKDFVHYEDKGIAIPPGDSDAQDQAVWAGSVFKDQQNIYHAFYTGYNYGYAAQGKASQVLMHATSADLLNWEKTDQTLTFIPQPGYDKDDWRDPYVLWDDEKQEYLLILGARKREDRREINGCTVKFTSKDLMHWEFGGDFWSPYIYTMHEMPDLFKIGEWWYLVISEYSDKNKIVYRRSKSLCGPWLAPVDDAFDGRAYYAGRTAEVNGQRVLFGWVPTRQDNDDRKNFEWGGTFVPLEVVQRLDGTLGVRPPKSLWDAFKGFTAISDINLKTVDTRETVLLDANCPGTFAFEADVCFGEGTRSFALKLLEEPKTGRGYQYIFLVDENRMVFEKTPNQPWFTCMNIGLERPVTLEANRSYKLKLIVDNTIATLFVDDVALNARMCERPGNALSVFVTDGELELTKVKISKTVVY